MVDLITHDQCPHKRGRDTTEVTRQMQGQERTQGKMARHLHARRVLLWSEPPTSRTVRNCASVLWHFSGCLKRISAHVKKYIFPLILKSQHHSCYKGCIFLLFYIRLWVFSYIINDYTEILTCECHNPFHMSLLWDNVWPFSYWVTINKMH